MRVTALYFVYLFAGFVMMFWFYMDTDVSPISSTIMATIWLYTLAWASNYTYVRWLGKLFRRQDRNDKNMEM